MNPRVTSFAPQFLVDDIERSIAYYERLGFTFGEPWEGFYCHWTALLSHLRKHGCQLKRGGRAHSLISDTLARKICRGLSVAKP